MTRGTLLEKIAGAPDPLEADVFFRQIYDRRLAQYAYMIGCQATGDAIVIDPMRDVERFIELAEQEGLRIIAAAETHIHADFLSGVRELAERTGATVYVSDEGGPDWQSEWIRGSDYTHKLLHDGDRFSVGNIHFDVIHTPGHTPEHICYLVTDGGGGATEPMGLLSGDFVFVGDVGRPDLLETAAGQAGNMDPSARTLYASIDRFRDLPPHVQVWPGHGAGSACGKDLGAVPMSTVGYELVTNTSLLSATSEDEFVSYILDGQPEPPLYFARMKRQNKTGPAVLGGVPSPRLIRQDKFQELSGATGVAFMDARSWDEYRGAHLPGALFTPLNSVFNTLAGSFVPDEMAIYLLVDEARLREAVVDLIHVGLDNIVGYATPEMFQDYLRSGGQTASIPEIEVAELESHLGNGEFLLDVRRSAELVETGFIAGTHNVAHTRLLERIDEVPRDNTVLVLCRKGNRSGYACGLLDRHGYSVVNIAGGIEAWTDAGGAVTKAP